MNIDEIAEAIWRNDALSPHDRECHWGDLSTVELTAYRRMAEAAVAAMELTQEFRPLPDGIGGVITNFATGEVTMHMKPPTLQMRWVTPWKGAQ